MTDVVMPQMGESIAEGTITKWLKNVGDRVERDEPLFEISTDKVDAEIPSPAAGVLTEIKFKEGETVEVNKVIAVLDGEGGDGGSASAASAPPVAEAPTTEVAKAEVATAAVKESVQALEAETLLAAASTGEAAAPEAPEQSSKEPAATPEQP